MRDPFWLALAVLNAAFAFHGFGSKHSWAGYPSLALVFVFLGIFIWKKRGR